MLGGATSNFKSAREAVRVHQSHYKMNQFEDNFEAKTLTIREAKDELLRNKRTHELHENQNNNFNNIISRHEFEHLIYLKFASAGGPTAYKIKEIIDLALSLLMIPIYIIWVPAAIICAILGFDLPELPSFLDNDIRLPEGEIPDKFTCMATSDGKKYYFGYERYGRIFPVTDHKKSYDEAYAEAVHKFGLKRIQESNNNHENQQKA